MGAEKKHCELRDGKKERKGTGGKGCSRVKRSYIQYGYGLWLGGLPMVFTACMLI